MKKSIRMMLFALLGLGGIAQAATATLATGGAAIPSNQAPGCSAAGSWTALTGPIITEANAGEIGVGDIIFTAPAGFEFDTAAAVTILLNGNNTASRNINNLARNTSYPVTSITATTITFNVFEVGTRTNTLTWQGVRVRPTASSPLASGNISYTGTSPIVGIPNGTNLGTLTEVNGAPVCLAAPNVTSINTDSPNPTAANTSVSWTVVFDTPVTGVDTSDFVLLSAGGVAGASITGISGSGTTYSVTANTGTGTVGTLTLRLVDDDSIVNASGTQLGGFGPGNGSFTGQRYDLIVPVCTPGLLFCDDFERSVIVGGANAANAVGTAPGYGAWTVGPLGGGCAGVAGNRGCAGIDSDIPPFSTATNPRANATRAMYTRWTNVMVTSPVINLAGKGGARLSFWLRRGSDCFSEWPSNNTWHTFANCTLPVPAFTPTSGEEFQVQYLNNVGTWVVLAQYPMDDAPGEILVPVIGLPDDALHAGFQFRFVQPGGSGSGATNGGAPGVRGYDYWHVDNVVLEEVPGVAYSGPFCDTFEGDLSRWDLAGTGNVRIGSTWFQNGAHNMDLRWNAVSATTKATDLSTNSGNNTISFWVKRGTGVFTTLPNGTGSEYPDTAAKGLRVDYLNNLGAWVQLGTTFAGAGTQGQVFSPTTTPATNSFAIPADAKHANFKLRIRMLAGSGLFDQDYWHVDDVCVGSTISATDLGLTMSSGGTFSPGQYVTYTMVVTNYGPNADPGPITITDDLPAGLTYVGGSAGWACSAAGLRVTCTQTGGLAANSSTSLTITATVDAGASGTVTNTATVGGQTNDNSLANNTASKTDTIFTPGYAFTDRACTMDGTPIDTGAQCNTITWSPQTAGTPLGGIYITAVDTSNVPIQLHATNPTTVNMQFGLSCINPVANAGVQATFYDATTTTTLPLCTANAAVPTSWSASRAVVFPAAMASAGPFSFNYNDVGAVNLYMRNSAVTSRLGQSSSFVVKPAGFRLSNIRRDSDGFLNPGSTTTVGAAFARAGEAFRVTVTALTSQGATAPNYGNEVDPTTGAPESVKLTQVNAVAAMVSPPAIGGNFGAFSAGVASGTNFTWEEVGTISIIPGVGDGNYLGVGDTQCNPALPNYGGVTACPPSGPVGRFYPDHFNTVVTQVGNVPMDCPKTGVVCPMQYPGFVYSGQPFTLSVKAMSKNNMATQNYSTATGFARTVALSTVSGIGLDSAPAWTGTLGVASLTAFTTGTGETAAETYTFDTDPSPPTNIYFRASDGEASSKRLTLPTTSSVEGGVAVVSGRFKVANAYGSELRPLTLTAMVQYYTTSGWLGSTTDDVTLPVLAATYDVKNTAGVTTGTTTPTLVPCSPEEKGKLCIRLSPPTGGAGVAVIAPTVPAYLCTSSCTGTATFGVYKNNNNFIYRREN